MLYLLHHKRNPHTSTVVDSNIFKKIVKTLTREKNIKIYFLLMHYNDEMRTLKHYFSKDEKLLELFCIQILHLNILQNIEIFYSNILFHKLL